MTEPGSETPDQETPDQPGGEPAGEPDREPDGASAGPATLDYEGPEVRASMEVMESEPPQYAVNVEVVAPTAGWELEADGLERDGDRTVVTLKLTEPGSDEIVAQVLQTKTVRVDLGTSPGHVQIRIARWQRGVEYLVPPAARLAAVVDR